MKVEEAIKWMEKAIQETERDFDLCSPDLQKELTEQKEVFETAISALRSLVESKDKDVSTLTEQLRRMSVETGSLVCLGCEREHNCGILGCALLRQAVETIEKQATVIDHLPDITKMVPLTLEQLRKMDGKVVKIIIYDVEPLEMLALVEYVEEADCIILTNNLGGRSEYYNDSEMQNDGVKAYPYPLPHIDREAWEPCEFCNGKESLYQYTNSTKLFINTFGEARTLVTECKSCPPYADCSMKNVPARSAFIINFCPHCGRPLTEEAWAELERRLRK